MTDIYKDFLNVKDLDNLIFNLKDLIIIELILSYLPVIKFKINRDFNSLYLFYDKKIDLKLKKVNNKKFYFPVTISYFFKFIPDILYEVQEFVVSDNHDNNKFFIDNNNLLNIKTKKIKLYRGNNSKNLILLDIHYLQLFQKIDFTNNKLDKLNIDLNIFKVLNNIFLKKFNDKFGSSSDYNYYDENLLKLYLDEDNNINDNDITNYYFDPDISYCNRTIHKPFDCGCNYCLRCYFRSILYEDSFLDSLDKGSSIDVTIFSIFFEEELSYDLLKKIFIRNKKELDKIKKFLFI